MKDLIGLRISSFENGRELSSFENDINLTLCKEFVFEVYIILPLYVIVMKDPLGT